MCWEMRDDLGRYGEMTHLECRDCLLDVHALARDVGDEEGAAVTAQRVLKEVSELRLAVGGM